MHDPSNQLVPAVVAVGGAREQVAERLLEIAQREELSDGITDDEFVTLFSEMPWTVEEWRELLQLLRDAAELLHADAAHPRSSPALLPQACYANAPDRSGRMCDKPKGHDGPHWTYGGGTLEWPSSPVEGQGWQTIHTCKVCGAECNC